MNELKSSSPSSYVAPASQPDIDALITSALDRRHLVDEISTATVSDIRRTVRRRRLRQWARVVAFSFGLPLIVIMCIYLIYMYALPAMSGAGHYALFLLIPLTALLYGIQHTIRNFSLETV